MALSGPSTENPQEEITDALRRRRPHDTVVGQAYPVTFAPVLSISVPEMHGLASCMVTTLLAAPIVTGRTPGLLTSTPGARRRASTGTERPRTVANCQFV